MLWITAIIDLVKSGVGYFTKRQQSKDELQAQNSHEQNQITLEETRKGFTWRQGLGWVLTFIVLWNYVMVPLLALMGVVLPVLPLDEVWKVLLVLIGN
ncbi:MULTISPECIES: hypothetical protein [Pectobacterium]|uniref:Uncharacterized protein n=1 Tax=Pectobacterium carotovorum subsp. carotovorum TaxID=555 RepID=A0AAI9KXJ7_PECCC|nr:hypothetical protein [Pectobacterium carotovorum]GKX45281.1 hypothetical protein SOASR016_00330 [Pectobacterium carotovorum subsp. carotovorum]GLV67589.1 hypothetical protein Pcaca03_00330 [Pectobacterium carotovorum subsp. carotovorum]